MPSPLLRRIADRIRADGPLTVADYVESALYDPEYGYYSTAEQRSGRAGDFFTSVDLGPLFGELLAVQVADMWRAAGSPSRFDLVEAAAGNGRLSRDIVDGLGAIAPDLLPVVRLHLVERSPRARAMQPEVLGPHAARLASADTEVPPRVEGVILANELLDALPPHVVVMRPGGLRELFVDQADGRLVTREGPASTPRLEQYLADVGVVLEPGQFAEVNLAAVNWATGAARSLQRGFLLLVDYGDEAVRLYSAARAGGTLMSFRSHASETRDEGPGWLNEPGERDLTSHVDLTGLRLAAEAAGLTTVGIVDQTYFLLGLGLEDCLSRPAADAGAALRRRLALKTLMLPGGMGSTHKVMIFARGVGSPALRGLAFGRRLT